MPSKYDYIILGAGPAGLQLAYCLQKKGHSYLVLEQGEQPGTFFKTYPRHRQLISINKRYTGMDDMETNLRWDWNSLLTEEQSPRFTSYDDRYFPQADSLLKYLSDFAKQYQLNVTYNTEVTRASKAEAFSVQTKTGDTYECKHLIIATGKPKAYIPEIPGIEHVEQYEDMPLDPEGFTNQRVLIIGKGNSAFETADNLIANAAVIHMISPEPVELAWESHYVGHLRAVNNNFLDTYQLKSQNTVLDATVDSIKTKGDKFEVKISFTHAMGQTWTLMMDRILLCTGFMFDDSIFDNNCKPELTPCGKFPAMSCEWESSNIEGMFFAGTLMHARDAYKTFSGFIHGFRYNITCLADILDYRYHGQSLPAEQMPRKESNLAEKILARLNHASNLFLQPGFLVDVCQLNTDEILYHCGLPMDYACEKEPFASGNFLTVSFEFGEEMHSDVFSIERVPDSGEDSAYLHPIIRFFENGEIKAEHHVIEDLENQYFGTRYEKPLVEFLASISL